MARPRKNNTPATRPVTDDDFEKVLDIDDANERSEELAKFELTQDQKNAAQDAAKEDFLGNGGAELEQEDELKPNKRAQKLLDDLERKGISTSYPSDFSKWDESTYQRLDKLNK